MTRHGPILQTTVEGAEVTGLFARPDSGGRHPGVIVFGGSGGGLGPAAAWAPALAERGFAVLALAFFGQPGLPPELREIDVEVVSRGVDWLTAQPGVAPAPVAVMGASRGSELAFLAGIHDERVGAIVGVVPSGISWFALGAHGPIDAPSWTVDGRAVPYPWFVDALPVLESGGPVALRPMHEDFLADPARIEHAELPVEECRGPLLLVSGDDDQMWPSSTFSELVVARLARTGANVECTHLRYPDAGHAFVMPPGMPVPLEVPAHPLTGVAYAFGGTEAGNTAAQADAWPRVVEFLADAAAGVPSAVSGSRRP